MDVIRALVVWLVIIAVESVHGIARTILLVPVLGDFRARQISVFTGSLLILLVAYFFVPWIAPRSNGRLFLMGGLWVAVTILFEITLGRLVLDLGWDRIFEDYDITRGGLLGFGLVWMSFCPWIATWLRRESPTIFPKRDSTVAG